MNNSDNYTTGCAGETVTAPRVKDCVNMWDTLGGVKASTTHNITGVYDVSGPRNDFVAGYYGDSTSSSLTSNGQPLVDSYNTYGEKYVDIYSSTGNIGQALYETRNWYDDQDSSIRDSKPFYERGWTGIPLGYAGIFAFDSTNGENSYYGSGSRAVVVSK